MYQSRLVVACLLFFLTCCCVIQLSAQCIIENPAETTDCIGCTRVGNTFEVCETGFIDSVLIYTSERQSSASTRNVRVGVGSIPMTSVLTTEVVGTVDLGDMQGAFLVDFFEPIFVTEGELLAIEIEGGGQFIALENTCLLYTSPSPRD